MASLQDRIKSALGHYQDFPKKGIAFKDIRKKNIFL